MYKPILDQKDYLPMMQGRRFLITGLVGQKSQKLNGKIGIFVGMEYQPSCRDLIRIPGDDTTYKIRHRNLVPQGYTLKTIHEPYQVMTLAQQQQIDELIANAQKAQEKEKEWNMCFKYIGIQKNYCFTCHQFGTACYDYCAYCGADYLRMLYIKTNKLMKCFKRCQGCIQRCHDLNLTGRCQNCFKRTIQKN